MIHNLVHITPMVLRNTVKLRQTAVAIPYKQLSIFLNALSLSVFFG